MKTLLYVAQSDDEKKLTKKEIESLDENVDKIRKIATCVSEIWGVGLNINNSSNDLFGGSKEIEEIDFAEDIPEPQKIGEENILSNRGKLQIKKGWRKSSVSNVPVCLNERAEKLVKNNEIKFLVDFSIIASQIFDEYVFNI